MDVVSKTSAVGDNVKLLTMAHHSLGPRDVSALVLNAGDFPGLTWRASVYQGIMGLSGSSAPLVSLNLGRENKKEYFWKRER